MRKPGIAKIVWIVLAVAVLAVTVYFGERDADIVMIWAMLLLGFPGSLLVLFGYAETAFLWHTYIADPLVGGRGLFTLFVAVLWSALFLAGYAQWFLLLPFLVRRWRSARERH